MKVGLSLSRCVSDIFEGNVDINDVLIVISRTQFDPTKHEQWMSIWNGYHNGMSNPAWATYEDEDEAAFYAIVMELHSSGRLHQPRQYGGFPPRMPYYWVETMLPSEELDKNPGIKAAWDKFQTLAHLSGVQLTESHG